LLCGFNVLVKGLTLYGHTKTKEQRTIGIVVYSVLVYKMRYRFITYLLFTCATKIMTSCVNMLLI